MKVIMKVGLTSLTLLVLTGLSVYRLPHQARFSAPHKPRLAALAARISLNPSLPARWVDQVLRISVPTVYAQSCGTKPLCDGTKVVPDNSGINNQPYCWFDGTNYSCAKLTCSYVGGSNLCRGPYQTDCKIPLHPGIYCNYADKVSCQ
jgi:hypothetical protein